MAILDHLQPQAVFHHFEALCAIPHGSGNTKAISDHLVTFARERGLEHYQDDLNNVIIIKPASPGYEQSPAVILQGHMDMVCEKTPGCGKDMNREGLDLAVEGDHIYAKDTTLGGDDGIAVAMALAVLEDESLPHPRIEAVFTVDEETGMGGAAGIDVSMLQGRRMLNIDSEAEGIFTVSCAGGNVSCCTLPLTRAPFSGTALCLSIQGLRGGHSGIEIHKGRANANQLLGRVLYALQDAAPLRLCSAAGGLKDNAIPVSAQALLLTEEPAKAQALCQAMEQVFRSEYAATDPGVTLTLTPGQAELPLDEVSTRKVIAMLCCLPGGIQSMSPHIPGLVQTSLNLGIFTCREDRAQASFCVRSSMASEKQMLVQRLRCFMEQLGGSVAVSGDYPAWEYLPQSPLREKMVEVFTRQYGHAPQVEAIHAGVECGLFAGKLPGLDCVSFGPDLTEIHTPREKMSISSVQRSWNFLLEVLRELY